MKRLYKRKLNFSVRLPQEGDQGPQDFRLMNSVGCHLGRKHGVRIKAISLKNHNKFD